MEINSMNTRPSVPRNVERLLWVESCGHCMNPECAEILIPDSTKKPIGEMAHIVPDSEGGDVSFDNLILLCSNCHIRYEPLKNPDIKETLRKWKRDAIGQNEARFSIKFDSFYFLRDAVKPLIEENYQIFKSYGPHTGTPEGYKLWQQFEQTLITNNAKLKLVFQKNIELLHKGNHKIITDFIAHANEFEVTRDGYDGVRHLLFPLGLLSLFDIEEELIGGIPPFVSSLQNFIKKLQDKEQFVSLVFFPDAILTYQIDGEIKKLKLNNRAEVQQLFFSEGCYFSKRTDLRIDSFLFALAHVGKSGNSFLFDDYSDLSVVTINNSIRVKFFYIYTLSAADLSQIPIGASHIVNLHNWNDKYFSEDAIEHADAVGLRLMSSTEFIRFCHRLNR